MHCFADCYAWHNAAFLLSWASVDEYCMPLNLGRSVTLEKIIVAGGQRQTLGSVMQLQAKSDGYIPYSKLQYSCTVASTSQGRLQDSRTIRNDFALLIFACCSGRFSFAKRIEISVAPRRTSLSPLDRRRARGLVLTTR